MKNVTDIENYRNRVYLELCLDLVEDAYDCLQKGRYDYVEVQLKDLLDTFDRHELKKNTTDRYNNILTS